METNQDDPYSTDNTHAFIPGQDGASARAVSEARRLLSHFEKAGEKRFELERIIGEGAWGVTFKMKIRERSAPSHEWRPMRRFVMKRSLTVAARQKIRREERVLRRLRGSVHIVQPYSLGDSVSARLMSRLGEGTLLMEWIGNGLLHDVIHRAADWGHPLPNRLLWRLFLCLCRMVIAMAWPPGGSGTVTPSVEVLPIPNAGGNRPPKSRLIHGDLNARNIMIGELEPQEHRLVPVLKLIDFGSSRDLPKGLNQPPDPAVKGNLLNIGQIMLTIVGGSHRGGAADMVVRDHGKEKTVKSYARDLDGLNRLYKAPASIAARHGEKVKNLDPDLRRLVVLSVASDVNERLDLEDLVAAVEHYATAKTQAHYLGYKYYANESDQSVARITRELILGAEDKGVKVDPWGRAKGLSLESFEIPRLQ
ncbi:kinase-like domain-containing protein [Durotheca rogersii]|uniref:kinase-like domain-containing protein n=1 Tax=Durotheca rogersii TaxID=419775 RepID=UPI00221F9986|nr:kinase-like domain-containing protein [Durotheca rogersii]KAI5866081.1 kinase-like domain-containing protein [Durotheca rogersii]